MQKILLDTYAAVSCLFQIIMILDLSSLEHVPNKVATNTLLQYQFNSEWQRIHLQLCIRSGFSFYVMRGNNGFILCLDDKDGTITLLLFFCK